MHWAALSLVGLVLVLFPQIYKNLPGHFSFKGLVFSALLVQNWGFSLISWNSPAWSLSTEWLVSLAFPMFLLSARRVTHGRTAMMLCFGCLMAFAAFLLATHSITPNVVGKSGVIRTGCEFAAGCFLYRIYAIGLRANITAELITLGAFLIGLLVPNLSLLCVFGFPPLILLATQPSSLVARTVSNPAMVFLGEISFSIYLLHWILLEVSNRAQVALGIHGFIAVLWFIGFTALLITLSTVTYYLIEIPARQRFRGQKIIRRRRKRSALSILP